MTEKINKIDATLRKLAEDTASGKSEPSPSRTSEVEYLSSVRPGR